MEKFTQKWAVIIPLEKREDGLVFPMTEFPLHITVAGVFATHLKGRDIEAMLAKIAASIAPFEVKADHEEFFGEDKSVAVMTLQKTPELMQVYQAVYGQLTALDVVFNTPQYEGEGYLPHSTHQKSGRLHQGEKVTARSIALVDLFPDGDGLMRKITKTFEFSS